MATATKYSKLTNKEIRAYAREKLVGNMIMPIIVTFFFFIIKNLFSFCSSMGIIGKGVPAFIFYISLFIIINTIFGLFEYGISRYFLSFITSKDNVHVSEIFGGFTHSTNTILSVSFIITLVHLLCISPYFIYGFFFSNSATGFYITLGLYFAGSIVSYFVSILFAPVYFIICDYDNIKTPLVFILTFSFMNSRSYFQYFRLQLSLLPFYLLGYMSLGLGLLWVLPYAYSSYAYFYESLCEDTINAAKEDNEKDIDSSNEDTNSQDSST